MSPGDITLGKIVQSDGRWKDRPLLLLREFPPFRDFIACAISSQLRLEVEGVDEVITTRDADFGTSGLKLPSLVRTVYLTSIPRSEIRGRLGAVSVERLSRILRNLSAFFARP